jgi:hypothetical protein
MALWTEEIDNDKNWIQEPTCNCWYFVNWLKDLTYNWEQVNFLGIKSNTDKPSLATETQHDKSIQSHIHLLICHILYFLAYRNLEIYLAMTRQSIVTAVNSHPRARYSGLYRQPV